MAQQTLNTPRETTHQRIADALEDIVDKIVDTSSASNIDYDNTQSGLNADKAQGAIDELAEEKVDKETGKGLSTNDYTDADKNKLADIEAEANKTVVDSAMSDRSTNPLQNRVITVAFDEKTDVNNFNALTQEFDLFNTYDLTNDVEISVFANETYKRDKYYDRSYETHIPNLDGEYSVSLGDKTFTETCTFTIANEGKSITEVFHTNSKYILGAKLLKAENDEVGDAHVIADVVTLLISKDAPYTTTFDPSLEHPPVTGVLTLKVSVKPDEKYVDEDNYAYWGSYNGSDLLINNPILTYSEITFGQPKVSGNPITINDAAEANAVDVSVDIEPVQDLHGYDHPWVGGAGKNLLPVTVEGIKSANTSGGTWSGNTFTRNGATITIKTDSDGNVTGIIKTGNCTSPFNFNVYTGDLSNVISAGNNYYTNIPITDNTVAQYQGAFTPAENWHYTTAQAYLLITTGNAENSCTPQLELGTTATSYEPYSNICPISGWDEVKVGVAGKNLFDRDSIRRGIYTNTDGTTQTGNISKNFSSQFIKIKPNTIYSITMFGESYENGSLFGVYYDEYKNGINQSTNILNLISNISKTFTTPSNAHYIVFTGYKGAGTDIFTTANTMVCEGTPTTYEPYNGKTYTIQLKDEQGTPITVYGGECDVVNGGGTGRLGYVDLGSLNWAKITSEMGDFFTASGLPNIKTPDNSICSQYKLKNPYYSNDDAIFYAYRGATSCNVLVRDSRYTDKDTFKTAMNGVQLVYELAEPYTIQLTPQQIKLLKGTNNITCNTGDLSIKYYPDNVLGQLKGDIESEYDAIIQNLLERIEALENQQ